MGKAIWSIHQTHGSTREFSAEHLQCAFLRHVQQMEQRGWNFRIFTDQPLGFPHKTKTIPDLYFQNKGALFS